MIDSHSTSSRLRKSGLTRTMATAAIATSSALTTVNAGVIYSGEVNLAANSTTVSVPVNVNNSGNVEFDLFYLNKGKGTDHSVRNFSSDFKFLAATSDSQFPFRLASDVSVSATDTFSSAFGVGSIASESFPGNVQWAPSDVGFMGFQFNPTGLQFLYGWAQISISADAQTMTLIDYAYEDSGSAITTPVPEPGTVAMGTIGAGIFYLVRRRKTS